MKIYEQQKQKNGPTGVALSYDELARKHFAKQVRSKVPGPIFFIIALQ